VRPFIEIEDLEYVYPLFIPPHVGGQRGGGEQITALRGVNLTIKRGEFVALIGPNGSGKSTLARHLNALLLPTSGTVWVDGLPSSDPRHLGAIRQKVGMVFQNPDNQIIATTLEEDVAFGPENLGIPPDEIRQRVEAALAAVELLDYRLHPPQMLSGGQKQRAAIAGALAARSSCIVFDEPTSMLDPLGRRQVMDTIRQLNATEGLTILLITHSMSEAMRLRRVLVMDAGQIVLDGPPSQVFSQVERLRDLRLDVPPIVEVAHSLRGWGMELPSPILTIEQMVAALLRHRRPYADPSGGLDPRLCTRHPL
jgi:energy-coupling factor transport system ATP-binding protein